MAGEIFTSDLPNDQDMIRALGGMAIPVPLFTDCCFAGVGDDDESLLVAVERKKVQDMVNSVNNGRFLGQLQVCKEMSCEVVALIVEGPFQSNPLDGLLEVPGWDPFARRKSWHATKPPMMYSRFDQYLTELEYLAGVIVKRSKDVRETADVIKALYINFQTPPSGHQSFHQMFSAPNPDSVVELVRPGLLRRVAKELSGIGWRRSRNVADHFNSVLEMASADESEWLEIPGIGKKTASKVVRDIRAGR